MASNCYYYNPFQTSNYDPNRCALEYVRSIGVGCKLGLTVAQTALYQNYELYEWMRAKLPRNLMLDRWSLMRYSLVTSWRWARATLGSQSLFKFERMSSKLTSTPTKQQQLQVYYGAQDWSNELSASSVFAKYSCLFDRLNGVRWSIRRF